MGVVTIGVDVGQRRDPTAIAVVEAEDRPAPAGRTEAHYVVRVLERLPLGTPYPDVAGRVAKVAAGVVEKARQTPDLYIDATGVGQPLVDVLERAGVKANLIPVYFTHGDRRTVEGGEVRLGKAYLVSRLQALIECGRLHLPRNGEADAMQRELMSYEIHVDADANDTYGAFRTGAHDDLVTAVGLAVQVEPAGLPFGWIKL